MKRSHVLFLGACAVAFCIGWSLSARSAEINDLNQVDANNTARFPENMAPSALNDGLRALEGILARFYADVGGRVTTTGTSTAYAYAATQSLSALYDGLILTFNAHTTNGGSSTLAVDAIAAPPLIKKYHDQNLAAGDIEQGQKVTVIYDGTFFQMLSATARGGSIVEDTAPTLGGNLNGGGFAASNLLSIAATSVFEGVTRVGLVGRQTIWIPSGAMAATVTSGPSVGHSETTATRPDINSLDFDSAQREHAQFNIAFPKSWDRSTLNYQAYWTEVSGGSTAGITLDLQCVAASDGDTIDVAYGTAVAVTDVAQSTAKKVMVTVESGALTVAGTPLIGDITFCQVYRDVADGNDTFAADMKLLGIKLFYSTATGNDQ